LGISAKIGLQLDKDKFVVDSVIEGTPSAQGLQDQPGVLPMAWYDLHFKLDKVKVVLLVVVDSTIEGTALHVN